MCSFKSSSRSYKGRRWLRPKHRGVSQAALMSERTTGAT